MTLHPDPGRERRTASSFEIREGRTRDAATVRIELHRCNCGSVRLDSPQARNFGVCSVSSNGDERTTSPDSQRSTASGGGIPAPRHSDRGDSGRGWAACQTRSRPQMDGNGRAGRLILNLKRHRADYVRALCRADSGDCGFLGELLARAVLDNPYKFVVPPVAGPVRLVPLGALANSRITSNALRVAAARGRLQATRGPDGEWRSSQRWVNEYLEGRYRRGL